MRYEVLFIDGLYCVFINNRICASYNVLDKAKECIDNMRRRHNE